MSILHEAYTRWEGAPAPRHNGEWLTTGDAARMLGVTVHGVRWLSRTGRLTHLRTQSGQRLYRKGDVLRLVEKRAQARLEGVAAGRSVGGPLGQPRQLSLFGKARLQLVPEPEKAKGHYGIPQRNVGDR